MDKQSWEKQATTDQVNFFDRFGSFTWARYKLNEKEKQSLWQNIAYAFCGKTEGPSENTKYSKEEKALTDHIYEKCLSYSRDIFQDSVYLAFLFVSAWNEKAVAGRQLIRLRRDASESEDVTDSYFIDHVGRVYSNWKCYLKENTWHGCWICLPAEGIYRTKLRDQQEVLSIAIIDCTIQSNKDKFFEKADTVLSYVSIVLFAVSASGRILTFTPLAPVGVGLTVVGDGGALLAATYFGARSAGKLLDRGRHDQTLNPFTSKDAKNDWICLGAAVLGAGTFGAGNLLSKTTRAGRYIATRARTACTVLQVTSATADGIEICNSTYEIAQRYGEDQEIPKGDVSQLVSDIGYFLLTIIEFKTAHNIVKKAQNKIISDRKKWFNFDKQLNVKIENAKPGRSQAMRGKAEFIKEIKHITTEEEFIEHFQHR